MQIFLILLNLLNNNRFCFLLFIHALYMHFVLYLNFIDVKLNKYLFLYILNFMLGFVGVFLIYFFAYLTFVRFLILLTINV